MQSNIHASLKWQDGGTPVRKWTGLCIFNHYLEFTALQWMWVLQHCSVHAFNMGTIRVFLCIWGCKSNEISLVQTTLTIPVVYIRGRMLGSDLTYWPPNQILAVHWDTTGLTTLEDHWSHKYTGMPLEPHWLMLAPSGVPVAIQC